MEFRDLQWTCEFYNLFYVIQSSGLWHIWNFENSKLVFGLDFAITVSETIEYFLDALD